jgi:hypothetical protein
MSEAERGEAPSQSVAKSKESATATDKQGRLITVNRLGALQFYRLTKIMGISAANPATMDMATLVASVTRINADPVAFPATERDIEFLIQQLDFDGIAAVGEALHKLSEQDGAEIETAKN